LNVQRHTGLTYPKKYMYKKLSPHLLAISICDVLHCFALLVLGYGGGEVTEDSESEDKDSCEYETQTYEY